MAGTSSLSKNLLDQLPTVHRHEAGDLTGIHVNDHLAVESLMHLPLTYLQAVLPQGTKEYVVCAAADRLSRHERLPGELIVGVVLEPREKPSDPMAADNFAVNPAFLNILHRIVERDGPEIEQLIVDAETVGDGKIYVVDGRAPRPKPGQEWILSSEDVLGEFDVKDGEIAPDSYRRNSDHRILSSEGWGFLQLEDELAECLIAELSRIPEPEGDYIAGGWEFIH